ncbi:hypothetical protein H5410_058464 [Solanum commersonii]|uniref:Disease resistance protein R3a-like protein n=1 Tax=Solanum commersonii TaxID=4109 RepID=A0A9J5WRN8_SOLCO|nr:hypothetical protein H5410_058464 [Solanum commersonii]
MEIGLAVGGAFLSSALNVLFDRLAPQGDLLNMFQKHKHHVRLLKKLKMTLLGLQAVLSDAENKQTLNQFVSQWLDELQDAVNSAENLIEEVNYEVLRLKVEGQHQNLAETSNRQVGDLNLCLSDDFFLNIKEKLEDTVETLEDLEKKTGRLGLKEHFGSTKQETRTPSTSLVDDSDVFGRQSETEDLIDRLLSEDASGKKLTVVPIVGMGGVGKTTLAKAVYNEERVKDHFGLKAWFCVSEAYDAFRITKGLLQEIGSFDLKDDNNLNQLQVKLKESLKGKKFLIVLDDVWNENYSEWDDLRNLFAHGDIGSKIIVTTRKERVALMMGSGAINVGTLSDEVSWDLFKRHSLENRDREEHPELEEVGKQIADKCKGLPLALKVLAGILRCKSEVDEWRDILRSEIWELPSCLNGILPALMLSYNDLPAHLKQCFAFCAIYPKDYEFCKDQVIHLWIANGLVQQFRSGNQYFLELRSRSLFERVPESEWKLEGFLMHDLVNDLAQIASSNLCIRLEENKRSHMLEQCRHMSYSIGEYGEFEKLKSLFKSEQLRTLLPINIQLRNYQFQLSKRVQHSILPKLRSLRVLSLSHYMIEKLPNDLFIKLKLLRFLDLSKTWIKKLPDSICGLYNLETLLLSCCHFLEELPLQMEKLINLHHLDISDTHSLKMPLHLSKLKNLQVLVGATFFVGSSRMEDLGEVENLYGSVSILELQNVVDRKEAVKAKMREKNHVEKLSLVWIESSADNSQTERDILDELRPHKNIKEVKIIRYRGTKFPNWLADPWFLKLVKLSLSHCKVCDSLPALGQLPCLKFLSIREMHGITEVTEEFYGSLSSKKPFNSLEKLEFAEMPEWKQWHILGNGEFPTLENLFIKNCPELNLETPIQLSSLKRFHVIGCPKHISEYLEENMDIWLPEIEIGAATRKLSVMRCHNLTTFLIPTATEGLDIWDCENLEKLSVACGGTQMTYLDIWDCKKLKWLPERMQQLLPSLKKLHLSNCPEIESFPEGGLPFNLQGLSIWNCMKLVNSRKEWCLQRLPCLTELEIKHDGSDKEIEHWELPCSIQSLDVSNLKTLSGQHLKSLTSLQYLRIEGNLPQIQSMLEQGRISSSSSLQSLDISNFYDLQSLSESALPSSLSQLEISHCPNLQSLPVKGMPSSLSYLSISNCPLLKPLLEFDKGALILARLPRRRLNLDNMKIESLYPEEMGPYVYVCLIDDARIAHLLPMPKANALLCLYSLRIIWCRPEILCAVKVELYSRCYEKQSLVIQGSGPGNDTTAASTVEREREREKEIILDYISLLALSIQQISEIDAENKQASNPSVSDWLNELRDAVDSAENFIEQVNYEALRLKVEGQHQNLAETSDQQVSDLNLCLSDDFFLNIKDKLEETIETLEVLEKQIGCLGLKDHFGSTKQETRTPSTSLVDDSDIFGRQNDIEELIDCLLFEDASGKKLTVVPIVGMGGVGKTTLAKAVYNDEKVKDHFGLKSWFCVSEAYDAFRITKGLLQEIGLKVDDNLNQVQVKLKESLKGMKFLIVLDDVWNDNYNEWDDLRNIFVQGDIGKSVALMMGSGSINVGTLSDEVSWDLFKRHSLENRDPKEHPELKEIGKQIADKCKGLPLALKALAGVLRCKSEVDEWRDILRSEIWELPSCFKGILPALMLSYNDLPSHLKQCFAYCAIYPKDYEFCKDQVIHLWMANDLLRSRSLFEMVSRSSERDIEKFLMHDLVNDLAQIASSNLCIRLEENKGSHTLEQCRHISYSIGLDGDFEKLRPLFKSEQLRTLLAINIQPYWYQIKLSKRVPHNVLPRLTSLRALSLSDYEIEELPDDLFIKLKLLRFLDISQTKINRLPDSICELPLQMEKLINLCHLDIRNTCRLKMPLHLSKLKSLQVLVGAKFLLGGLRMEDLGEVHNLYGSLSILELQNMVDRRDAMKAKMREKNHVDKLSLEWSESSSADNSQTERDILDELRPHKNIKEVEITRYRGITFPNWLADPLFLKLVKLSLSSCKDCYSLPALGQLPSLKYLYIGGMHGITEVTEEFYGSLSSKKPFNCLEKLDFVDMSEWKQWHLLGSGEFPTLEKLKIKNCPELSLETPIQLSSLKRFEVIGCPKVGVVFDDAQLFTSQLEGIITLSGCQKLKLEEPVGEMSMFLEDLTLLGCNCIDDISPELLPRARKLSIWSCDNLTRFLIPSATESLNISVAFGGTQMTSLSIQGCKKLEWLPERMQELLPSLEALRIALQFTTTSDLKLHKTGEWPKGVTFTDTSLSQLWVRIGSCLPLFKHLRVWNLKTLSSQHLKSLTSLQYLCIANLPQIQSMLEQGGLPSSLSKLFLYGHDELHSLGLWHLTLLQSVYIINCPNLQSLSESALPSSLSQLNIENCPKLQSFPVKGMPSLY